MLFLIISFEISNCVPPARVIFEGADCCSVYSTTTRVVNADSYYDVESLTWYYFSPFILPGME